ncbi:MAG: ABC transporter permease [Clostridia bacterium]|nr:ABC transporter permease [Clostridia bacterium]
MKNLKSFLEMVKFESLRVIRNKTVICMFVLFPIVLLLILGGIFNTTSYKVAINKNGVSDMDLNVIELIEKKINIDNVIEVSSDEEGKELMFTGEAVFYIALKKTTSEIRATIYYDHSTITGQNIKSSLTSLKNQYAYNTVKKLLKNEYGVTLDEKYFNLMSFKNINVTPANYNKSLFVMEFSIFLAIVMMFGLAFSISRDNETGVSKQLAYTPIGYNKYLMSKFIPYLVLGLFQSGVMLVIGKMLFEMEYNSNILLYMLVILLFIFALLSLGIMISMLKNQIVVAIISMATIILPIFALFCGFVTSYPPIIRVFLYLFPLTNFIELFRNILFNNIILYKYIVILLVLTVVYYVLALIIIRKKSFQK